MKITRKTLVILLILIIFNAIILASFLLKNKKLTKEINNIKSEVYFVEEIGVE